MTGTRRVRRYRGGLALGVLLVVGCSGASNDNLQRTEDSDDTQASATDASVLSDSRSTDRSAGGATSVSVPASEVVSESPGAGFWTIDGSVPALAQECLGVLGACVGEPMSDAIARLGPPASSHTLGGLMDGFTEHKWELPGGSAELIADDSGVIEGGSVVADGQLKVSLPGPSLLGELTPQGLVATRGDPPAFDARWLAGRTSVGYGYCEGPNAAYDVAFVIVVADGVLDLSDKSTAEIRELTVTLPFGGFNFSPGNIGGHCPL